MTEEETKKFLIYMRNYAISRGSRGDSVDDFPAHAWEMLHVRKWKATYKQVYADFIRNRLGAEGSHKSRCRKLVSMKAHFWDEKKDYIQERIGKSYAIDDFLSLPLRDQMLTILIQAGYSIDQINQTFKRKITLGKTRERENIREKRNVKSTHEQWAQKIYNCLNDA